MTIRGRALGLSRSDACARPLDWFDRQGHGRVSVSRGSRLRGVPVTGTFKETLAAGYKLDEPGIVLGSPLDGATVYPDVRIQVALSMLSRHGLIAGATGTGKTKTLQGIAGQLSLAGVPCLVA